MPTTRKFSFLALGLSAVLASASVFAADDLNDLRDEDLGPRNEWHMIKNDAIRNIKTYSKQEDGKRVRSFRVDMIVDASMETVARVHFDADNIKRWFWETLESRMLKKVSNTEYYYYQKFNAPITMPDRDSVLRATIEPYTTKRGFMTITLRAAPDFMPPQPGLVRVQVQDMVISLTPVGIGVWLASSRSQALLWRTRRPRAPGTKELRTAASICHLPRPAAR